MKKNRWFSSEIIKIVIIFFADFESQFKMLALRIMYRFSIFYVYISFFFSFTYLKCYFALIRLFASINRKMRETTTKTKWNSKMPENPLVDGAVGHFVQFYSIYCLPPSFPTHPSHTTNVNLLKVYDSLILACGQFLHSHHQ